MLLEKTRLTCSFKPCCLDVVSLLGLLLKICVWVTVRLHDTAKKLSVIHRYQDYSQIFKVMLSLATGRSFCKHILLSDNFKTSLCILLLWVFIIYHNMFTASTLNQVSPLSAWLSIRQKLISAQLLSAVVGKSIETVF